jgi:hypothetical protein
LDFLSAAQQKLGNSNKTPFHLNISSHQSYLIVLKINL